MDSSRKKLIPVVLTMLFMPIGYYLCARKLWLSKIEATLFIVIWVILAKIVLLNYIGESNLKIYLFVNFPFMLYLFGLLPPTEFARKVIPIRAFIIFQRLFIFFFILLYLYFICPLRKGLTWNVTNERIVLELYNGILSYSFYEGWLICVLSLFLIGLVAFYYMDKGFAHKSFSVK